MNHAGRMALVAATVCILNIGVTGCARVGTNHVVPGVLRLALPDNPSQLNPILAEDTAESFLDGLIFSELVTLDTKGNDVPELASAVPTLRNGGISKDGLTLTYRLRHNVQWQDGAPFTSRDVKFTWQAIMNPANNVLSRRGYDQVASVDTPDPYTVIFHMRRIFAPAIDTIFAESDTPYRILPAHLLAKYPNINQIAFNAAPVGTGPFKFVRWVRNDEIVLDANEHFFRGRPGLKQIIVKLIPSNDTIAIQLRTHEVDLGFELGRKAYHDLAGVPGVRRLLVPTPGYTAIFFNVQHPPFNDVRVRKAFALALDRASLTQKLTYGTAQLAAVDLSPVSWGYNAQLQPLPYDPVEAQRLLAQAGWHLRGTGADRTLEKNGRKLSVELPYGNGEDGPGQVLVDVQQMLSRVGINVELKGYNPQILGAPAQDGGILYSGKFDVISYGWISGADPDNSSQWTCPMIPPNGNNLTRYCSPEMDAAQQLALSTFNRAIRKRAYAKIESLMLRDLPAIFIYHPESRYAFTPQLHGFTPNGISEGWNAYTWTI